MYKKFLPVKLHITYLHRRFRLKFFIEKKAESFSMCAMKMHCSTNMVYLNLCFVDYLTDAAVVYFLSCSDLLPLVFKRR